MTGEPLVYAGQLQSNTGRTRSPDGEKPRNIRSRVGRIDSRVVIIKEYSMFTGTMDFA